MFADYESILRYLLARGLIEEARIAEGDLILFDASRRNCNVKVVSVNGPSWFLKQDVGNAPGADGRYATVAHEAAVYGFLSSHAGKGGFNLCLPRLRAYDDEHRLLILEAVNGESLAAACHRTGEVASAVASQVGRSLALLHDGYANDIADWLALAPSPGPPWSSLLPEATEWTFLNVSAAVLELLSLVSESSVLAGYLDELKAGWSPVAVIHGDLRWDNCIVLGSDDASPDGAAGIRIVDWELATVGDPAWDVGTFLCEYVNAWLSSVPIRSAAELDRFLDLATLPLQRMHESIAAFWNAYAAARKVGTPLADLLERACRCMGARMIVIACEELQDESRLTAKAVAQVQLAENVLARPMEAAVRLLGIHRSMAVDAHAPR